VTLCVAAALVAVGLGFIHIIIGVTSDYELPFDIVRKEHFAYRETLVNAGRIEALPYPAAVHKYPRGVRALQRAGYLPSGLEFEARMMAVQQTSAREWEAEFENTLGPPPGRWQDELRTPEQDPPPDPQDARAYHQQGVALARRGEYRAALAELGRAIRKDPTCADAYYNRALVYTALGNLGAAASDLGQVAAIRPQSIDAYLRRSRLQAMMNEHDQALASLTQALQIDPQCAPAYFRRSLIHYTTGAYDQAWEDVRQIESLHLPIPAGFREALEAATGKGRAKTPHARSRR
jgi:tetratricopeptide (TPR) repeat protein